MTDYARQLRLDGKVAIVTGAASGIGAEIACALAQVGAKVLVTDLLNVEGAAVVARIQAGGGQALFLRHDVTQEADWEKAVRTAVDTLGGLDVLVNNAGIETAALLSQCDVADFRRVLDVNVTGVFLGIKHAIRAMTRSGVPTSCEPTPGGSIVNLSSIAAMIGTSAHAAYHASKGAVRSLTKAAAVECAQLRTGIRVNSIHPGIVRTAMGMAFIQHLVDLKLLTDFAAGEAAFSAAHPLGFGVPSDVASAVLYLASDASRWSTGTELVLDGGYSAA
jgi:NAD(P)-dependent dehydrogenase (short-subunit alcohol dehydrogenase family)